MHDRLGVDAWLVGRVTGQEYAKRDAYSPQTGQRHPREAWFARRDAAAYGIVLDPSGKIAWGRADISGDSIVAVLTEQAGDAHLAGLRDDGVSYIFAGMRELDLGLALDILNRELGIKRLEVNGGGITNGAFLRAGLIDEISVAISRPWMARKARPAFLTPVGRDRHASPALHDASKQRSAAMRRGLAALPCSGG